MSRIRSRFHFRSGKKSGGAPPPAFTPAQIFSNTDEGFWAPVTTSRLWQDVARTTPVTAAGQTVASWELTTRTGVIYAEQPTPASRPTYQVDGLAGYLDMATDKWMQTPVITPAADKSQAFAGVTFRAPNGGTRVLLESSTNSDLVSGAVLFFSASTTLADMRFRSKGTTLADAISPQTYAIGTANKYRVTGLGDIAGDSSIVRVDGTQVGSSSADQGTGNYGAHAIFIGGRTGLFWGARLYGLVLRFGPNLSPAQVADTEAWMASVLNP